MDELDGALLAGGRLYTRMSGPRSCPTMLTASVRKLWTLRATLKHLSQEMGSWASPRTQARRAMQAWAQIIRLNRHNRELRKECRQRKTAKIEEVVCSKNIHQAAKRFAPKAQRRRLQLRDATGGIQTHEAEFEQIKTYFVKLYDGPKLDAPRLSQCPLITVHEVTEVAPILTAQFNLCLSPGANTLPDTWCISDLILIPKLGKQMKTPGDLRPLSLLTLPAKALAAVVASRLQPYAVRFLEGVPQYAYVPGRTLSQALERVFGHCAAVRALLPQGHQNIHAKRQGHRADSLCSGCMLSLDISKAYDCVDRHQLEEALKAAAIPQYLIEMTLLIHRSARIRISHCGLEEVIGTHRGLRQGCSLSPILWAILTGWMLRQMEDPMATGTTSIVSANTTYADDQHYAWQVRKGLDMENAYAAMKHILGSLRRFGLQISTDKTVILLDLRGQHAQRVLQRYLVDTPQGKCMKFVVHGEATYVRIVPHHVYLGAVISYNRFEHETLQHRMRLAKGVYSRLGSILRHRSVPLKLRLQLWQGCVWPTLLHALDSSGLPGKDLQAMQTLLLKQVRSIARSHSMLTRETNRAIIDRLRLPDPVRRLQQALTRREQQDSALGEAIRPGREQLQWRSMVRGHLFDSMCVWQARPEDQNLQSRLVPVQLVLHEQYECEVCGQCFSTQASHRRHMYLNHFDHEQKQKRDAEVHAALMHSNMEHSVDGMPTCKHCKHQFSTWHAFNYHISSKSCTQLRVRTASVTNETEVAQSDALVANEQLLDFAKQCTWQQLALHPMVRKKHNHCPECNHWSSTPQYVKRHMLSQHPNCKAVVEDCMKAIKESKLSLTNLCQYCGLEFKRKDAHLRSCIGIFHGVYVHRRLARGARLVLEDAGSGKSAKLTNLALHHGRRADGEPGRPGRAVEGDDGAGPAENPSSAGGQQSTLLTGNDGDSTGKPGSATTEVAKTGPKRAEFAQMKSMLNMVTTLVIRQEIQQNICRLDSGYMLFIQTTAPESLALSTYKVGLAWHQMKQSTPEKLTQPMRVVLFQHLLTTVRGKFDAMMASPSSRSKAEELGWISKAGDEVYGLRWNAEEARHERDPQLPSLKPMEVREAIDELIKLSTKPMVIHRYHATRQMAETYQSPTLAMMIEVGSRVEEAQLVWKRLHLLSQSAAWTAAGCFLRHERLKLGALAMRLKSMAQ
ncbi:unnamed protein product [Symbiodinium sp. CCMP2592]|nr:unnamed protein product [Symbiodinium sp. CCMP2592]